MITFFLLFIVCPHLRHYKWWFNKDTNLFKTFGHTYIQRFAKRISFFSPSLNYGLAFSSLVHTSLFISFQWKRMLMWNMWYIEVGAIFHMQLSFGFERHIRLGFPNLEKVDEMQVFFQRLAHGYLELFMR